MRIVIFGANGQTGRLLTRRALYAGHAAVAVTRRPDDFPYADPQLTVVGAADVRDPSSLVPRSTVPTRCCRRWACRSAGTPSIPTRSASATSSRRWTRPTYGVWSSSARPAPTPTRPHDTPVALRIFEPVITRTIGKTTYDDKRRMETIVRDSDLDWTIVRPSGLFDLPKSRPITLPETAIQSVRSPRASTWPTTWSPSTRTRLQSATPSCVSTTETRRRCGR